ncbi:MAG TPA: hypothetical protein VM142_02195 [Acidimicrobiales bacterium]|nr:hypothetical protein [Acidimicrobiales bacterium]
MISARGPRFVVQRSVPRSVPAYDRSVRALKSVSVLHAMVEALDPENRR